MSHLDSQRFEGGSHVMDRQNGLVNFLSRTPFPSVQSYVTFSFLITSLTSAYLAHTFTQQPELLTLLSQELSHEAGDEVVAEGLEEGTAHTSAVLLYYILSNTALTCVLINTYFALLALSACKIISFTFKELTRQEEAVVRHGFFSFLLFNIVFLSVVAAHSAHRFLPWMMWFGLMGFMSVLHQVTYQRFKLVSPSTPPGGRVSWLCFSLFALSTVTLLALCKMGRHTLDTSHFLFLLVDAVLSLVRSSHGLLRSVAASQAVTRSADAARHLVYRLDLAVSLLSDSLQLANYGHLMMYAPLGLNLTCMFFLYHVRLAYGSISATLERHSKHQRLLAHIHSTFPQLAEQSDDLCAVCWEPLRDARSLPCSHPFHDWCVMWWLEQDATCPTCRRVVQLPPEPRREQPQQQTTQFHFGGGALGFFSLPAFSIEFSHAPLLLGGRTVDESQLNNMAQQLREMFPQMSMEALIADLRVSGSIQATSENILEGRVVGAGAGLAAAQAMIQDESDDDSWPDVGGAVDELVGEGEEETERQSDDEPHGMSETQRRRKAMIAEYRKRYLMSDRGADLRARGITE